MSTESEWHDCSLTHNIELHNLPDGVYSVEIANDLNTNDAGNQLHSGIYARCFQSPPPPPTAAISVSSMEIGPVPTPVVPVQPQPTPSGKAPFTTPGSLSGCVGAEEALEIAQRRFRTARKKHRGVARAAASYRKAKQQVRQACG